MPAGAARRSFAIDFRLPGQTGGSGDFLNSVTEIQLEPVSKSICCAYWSTFPGRLKSTGKNTPNRISCPHFPGIQLKGGKWPVFENTGSGKHLKKMENSQLGSENARSPSVQGNKLQEFLEVLSWGKPGQREVSGVTSG
jgi:hypothetical protein